MITHADMDVQAIFVIVYHDLVTQYKQSMKSGLTSYIYTLINFYKLAVFWKLNMESIFLACAVTMLSEHGLSCFRLNC